MTRARKVQAAVCGAIAVAGLLLLFRPPAVTRVLDPARMQPVEDRLFQISLRDVPPPGFDLRGDDLTQPYRSGLVLKRDGMRLGPAHAVHDTIRTAGGGAYSHWLTGLYFSTPDDSDPRVGAQAYTVTAPLELRPVLRPVVGFVVCAMFVLGLMRLGVDWRTAAKVLALAALFTLAPWFWFADIAPTLERLGLAGEFGLLAGHAAVVVLSTVALCVAPFLADWRSRLGASVLLIAGFAVDDAVRAISGQPLRVDLARVLVQELEMASTVLPAYAPALTSSAVVCGLMLGAFVLRPTRWRLGTTALLAPVAAWLGAIGLSASAGGQALYVPSPVGTLAQLTSVLRPVPSVVAVRQEIAYARTVTPLVSKIVMVVDESVRGDVLEINDPRYVNTPFLRGIGEQLVNFGVAVSATNCSVASRVVMRMGLRSDQLPDVAGVWKRRPTLWRYAARAGLRTMQLDAWDRPHSYMNDDESAEIGAVVRVVAGEEYDRDRELAATLAARLAETAGQFLYVNKFGIHPRYALRVPPGLDYGMAMPPTGVSLDERRQQDVRDYHTALRWSVDEFFRAIWPSVDDETVILYTSDHGQSLYEGGYDLSHCSLTPRAHPGEVRVPLFVLTRNQALRARLAGAAERLRNRADHYAVFPTLLELMGYASGWTGHEYGPSLFTAEASVQRRFLIGTFDQAGSYWVDYDAPSATR